MEHTKFWEDFFQLYKDMPALWRVKSTAYTDRVLKSKCYMKLIEKLRDIYPDADREMVVKKINNFRTSYRKELRRLKESKEIGKIYKPTLWYFNCLRFLDGQDEGWVEKSIHEDENTEEKPQQSQDVTNAINCKKSSTKRCIDFKDCEEEFSATSPKRIRRVVHHFQKKKSRKPSYEEKQQANIDADILAKSWALQYNELIGRQKLIARKLISDILFYGCIGTLDMSNIIDVQEIFQNESTNSSHDSNIQPQSPTESKTSFRVAQQELFNSGTIRESPIEFNSSSPTMSPTTNFASEIQASEIKFEEP